MSGALGRRSTPSTSPARREARRAGPARGIRRERPAAPEPTARAALEGARDRPERHGPDHRPVHAPVPLRGCCVPVLAGFAAVCWFVLIHKGVASATAPGLQQPGAAAARASRSASRRRRSTSSATPPRAATAAAGPAAWAPGSTWSGPPSTRTSPTPTACRGAARLRTDLGGLYFNAVIAVVTLGVWLAVRADALLLIVALQMLEMVKNLSPVIRSDGYHILVRRHRCAGPVRAHRPDPAPAAALAPPRAVGADRARPRARHRVGARRRAGAAEHGAERDPAAPEARGLDVGERVGHPRGDPGPGRRWRDPAAARVDRSRDRARAAGRRHGPDGPAPRPLGRRQGVALERRSARTPSGRRGRARPDCWHCSPGRGGRRASTNRSARATTGRCRPRSGLVGAARGAARPAPARCTLLARPSPGRRADPVRRRDEAHPALFVITGRRRRASRRHRLRHRRTTSRATHGDRADARRRARDGGPPDRGAPRSRSSCRTSPAPTTRRHWPWHHRRRQSPTTSSTRS